MKEFRNRVANLPPLIKYALITLALTLWGFGLVDQLYSSAATMKYVLMSLLIVAIAVI
jgi:hypothetical protein